MSIMKNSNSSNQTVRKEHRYPSAKVHKKMLKQYNMSDTKLMHTCLLLQIRMKVVGK